MRDFSSRLQIIFVAVLAVILFTSYYLLFAQKAPIKVGILHSLTGSLALSEKPMVDAELMAIDEINAQGGIGKRRIIPIIADGKSDEKIFAQEAQRLIEDEKVAMIIGCWTSASRKAVKPIVERHNNLLIYPVSYEGIEESSNILYTGATQNQQIVPCALWSFYNLGKRFFLVGSDYIFSHMAHAIIKETLTAVNAQVIGQDYLLLGGADVQGMVQKIIKAKPDVIINTIQGESNIAFFKELRAQGLTPEKTPVMSISSVSEIEFERIGSGAMAGDYVTASYFQSIEREENTVFVSNFKKRYGSNRVVSESVEAAYLSVYLWADAVKIAGSAGADKVIPHLYNRVFNAPGGIIYTDNKIPNIWKMIYVGKLRSDGQFSIVWNSKKTVRPLIFPLHQEKSYWQKLESDLYEYWGNRWSKIVG